MEKQSDIHIGDQAYSPDDHLATILSVDWENETVALKFENPISAGQISATFNIKHVRFKWVLPSGEIAYGYIYESRQ